MANIRNSSRNSSSSNNQQIDKERDKNKSKNNNSAEDEVVVDRQRQHEMDMEQIAAINNMLSDDPASQFDASSPNSMTEMQSRAVTQALGESNQAKKKRKINNNQQNKNSLSSDQLLILTHEKISNCEAKSNKLFIENTIKNNLIKLGRLERQKVNSTITIKNTNGLSKQRIENILNTEFTNITAKNLPIIWGDSMYTYVQFMNNEYKNELLDEMRNDKGHIFHSNIVNIAKNDSHYVKPMIRLEIANTPERIPTTAIEKILKSCLSLQGEIGQFKSGNTYGSPKVRTISFLVNADAFLKITEKTGWMIPYIDRQTKQITRLYIKINCKPWLCKECHSVHPKDKCSGKRCGRCGKKDHIAAKCESITTFCPNCRISGHQAKDAHCSYYLNHIVRNLLRVDLPITRADCNSKIVNDIVDNIQIK